MKYVMDKDFCTPIVDLHLSTDSFMIVKMKMNHWSINQSIKA